MTQANLNKRLDLLHENVEGVMAMLAKVVTSGEAIDDLVVVVADARDPVGALIAQAQAKDSPGLDVDALTARARATGKIPTTITVLPRRTAIRLFSPPSPAVVPEVAQPIAPGLVRVVVVAAGGSTLVGVPVDLPTGGGSA